MENTIGIRLQQLIKDHEQTNAKAAEAIGVSASLISDIINDKKKQGIGADIVKRICKHYHVSSDWLLGIESISDELTPPDYIEDKKLQIEEETTPYLPKTVKSRPEWISDRRADLQRVILEHAEMKLHINLEWVEEYNELLKEGW